MSEAPGFRIRRGWLLGAGSLAALAFGFSRWGGVAAKATVLQPGDQVTIEEFSTDGASLGARALPVVVKSEDGWRQQLSRASFVVTRQEGTERPFTGALLQQHASGIYRCICCDTALFDSATKFESGTGWPSFWQPIAASNVLEISDRSYGMLRTAVECRRCAAHLGHVFDDGPKPTGLRYCMNAVSLSFTARPKTPA